jgi:hypothetical protein
MLQTVAVQAQLLARMRVRHASGIAGSWVEDPLAAGEQRHVLVNMGLVDQQEDTQDMRV